MRITAITAILGVLVTPSVLSGCRTYAHRAHHNAPGTTDLRTPLRNENGDPMRYEQATDPGSETLMVAVAPYIIGGVGRDGGGGEAGMELRFEKHASATGDLLAGRAMAVTAGMGFAQFSEHANVAPGAFYGELNYRFRIKDTIPVDVGIGPALYSGDVDAGGQISVRFPGLLARLRYMANTGTEVMFGYELPVPFFFSRSR